jgi:hypothetical protein
MPHCSLLEKTFLALLCVSLAVGNAAAQRGDPHARVAYQNGWLSNLRTAKEKAKKTGNPIMVVIRCFR